MFIKKISYLSLVGFGLVSSFSALASHNSNHQDLYSTKGSHCEKDCRGYWGFGLGFQNSGFDNDAAVTVTDTGEKYKYKFKDDKSDVSGKLFVGYDFYDNHDDLIIGVEVGAFGPSKKIKKPIVETPSRLVPTYTRNVSESFDRTLIGFASIKPHYVFNDIWSTNIQAGVAMGYFDYEYDLTVRETITGTSIRVAELKAKRVVPGWTLGLGVSMNINQNWSASLDYDFVRLTDNFSEFTNSFSTTKSDLQMDTHLVTLNLVHDFNCA